MSDLQRYAKAMTDGMHHVCVQIEKRHDLYGYPPEIVCAGLKAFEEGRDPLAEVDRILGGDD
jgi:hypothetical protein